MTTPKRNNTLLSCIAGVAMMLALLVPAAALAGTTNQYVLSSHFGREVDATTAGDVCTVASGDQCQPGKEGGQAGAYSFPASVAVNATGDLYVADPSNHRVQELAPDGSFITMFGTNVNKTAVEGGGTPAQRDVCTAVSEDECQAGEEGSEPGQFESLRGVTVDPAGDVFTAEDSFGELNGEFAIGGRIQKFTGAGQFVLEIGAEVNETSKANLCTEAEVQASVAKCQRQAFRVRPSSEPGVFSFGEGGDLLTVGGPEGLLYAGDEGRVQVFKTSGVFAKAVALTPISESGSATGVAVDATGDLFVADSEVPAIHEFNPAGQPQPQPIGPAEGTVHGLALNANGQLGFLNESFPPSGRVLAGLIYSTSGAKISEFAPSSGPFGEAAGVAFAPAAAPQPNELLVVTGQELQAYDAVQFATLTTCPAEQVTATGARLCGEVNPNGVLTNAFFEYGTTEALGSRTPVAFTGSGSGVEPVHATPSLTPNQSYHFKLAGEAEIKGRPLVVAGEEATFHTAVIAPEASGQPAASFVTAQSAVLGSSLNPEHTPTRYHFEYGACPSLAGCPAILSTPDQESSVFGVIGSAQEVSGLTPQTTYSYRLIANNEFEEAGKTLGGAATGIEGTFITSAAPAVTATTGAASSVSTTGAVLSGSVNPDGQPAIYTFELGVYNGASTSYGLVFSAPAGSATTPVGESEQLTGLQPGTVYAYRIAIHGGYGQATGQTETFATEGLPSVLAAPPGTPLLAIPNVAFPAQPSSGPPAKKLTRAQLLARALKACKKDKKKSKRAACIKQARKSYGPVKKKKAK